MSTLSTNRISGSTEFPDLRSPLYVDGKYFCFAGLQFQDIILFDSELSQEVIRFSASELGDFPELSRDPAVVFSVIQESKDKFFVGVVTDFDFEFYILEYSLSDIVNNQNKTNYTPYGNFYGDTQIDAGGSNALYAQIDATGNALVVCAEQDSGPAIFDIESGVSFSGVAGASTSELRDLYSIKFAPNNEFFVFASLWAPTDYDLKINISGSTDDFQLPNIDPPDGSFEYRLKAK